MTNLIKTLPPFLPPLMCLALAAGARAETVRLKSGEAVTGTLVHYYGGIASIQLPGGATRAVGQNEIAAIEFAPRSAAGKPAEPADARPAEAPREAPPTFLDLSKPASRFATPAATFEAWRRAAVAGEIDAMVGCYASFKQKEIRKQLKDLSKDAREKMRDTTARTEFAPSDPFYQGDRAWMEVRWTSGLFGDSQVLQFLLEKNEWKIVQ